MSIYGKNPVPSTSRVSYHMIGVTIENPQHLLPIGHCPNQAYQIPGKAGRNMEDKEKLWQHFWNDDLMQLHWTEKGGWPDNYQLLSLAKHEKIEHCHAIAQAQLKPNPKFCLMSLWEQDVPAWADVKAKSQLNETEFLSDVTKDYLRKLPTNLNQLGDAKYIASLEVTKRGHSVLDVIGHLRRDVLRSLPPILMFHYIPMNILVQQQGDLFLPDSQATHEGWNTGNNIAKAVNYADMPAIEHIEKMLMGDLGKKNIVHPWAKKRKRMKRLEKEN
ncbi:hypothetical protein M408DRAFT_8750 [Serendipita vermifera MAFF 305830]|uniref:Uncharacterized protein n=1 Tax=Serendipita vermifera MAFF 305830 TaxID=933852 RepID=A0A0C3AVW5_SERVB|nr:hypothetical protein M408DRAFT_8750 [Serendipita vermifera MAFF 305830]